MTLQERLRQLLERDPQLRAVREKIRAGTATFSDTARYTARAADILGDILGSSIQDIQQGQREALLTALMQERYDDTFALLEAVQKELDAKQGIRIDPQKADYPQQRVQRAGRKADDPETSEETLRRIAEAVFPNIALSFHDDYMAKNAQFRSRLGLQCHITRTGGANCCDWCAGVEGRYLYQERPADIFRRHDNCKCDIIYETQKGTTQLLRGKETADGRSSKSWQIAVETYGFHPVSYRGKEKPKGFVPVRYTATTAPQGFAPMVLTGGAKSGTIALLDSVELFIGGSALPNEQKKPIEEAIDKIPKKLLESLSSYISKIELVAGRGYSSYNHETKEIILDREKAAKDILHEFGHAFGDMLGLYEKPEFLQLIANGLDLRDWKRVVISKHPATGETIFYYKGNGFSKFVLPYQGRIYVQSNNFGIGDIDPAYFREYISVGFDFYFNRPHILEKRDPDLYRYLEVLMNGFADSGNQGKN